MKIDDVIKCLLYKKISEQKNPYYALIFLNWDKIMGEMADKSFPLDLKKSLRSQKILDKQKDNGAKLSIGVTDSSVGLYIKFNSRYIIGKVNFILGANIVSNLIIQDRGDLFLSTK